MKMIKAMKKLKFWSRKKKRKKSYEPYNYYQTNPSTCHQNCCSCSSSTQPSAPPLPPWMDFEQTEETVYAAASNTLHYVPEMAYPNPSQTQFPSHEVAEETSTIYPLLPVNSTTSSSYQQYMVPNPVSGLPVVQPAKERSAGFFGCFVNFSVNLIRCFCPCLSIREVNYQDSIHEKKP